MVTKKIEIKMRKASEVMTLERIGVFRQTSLSFLRIMLRNMMREHWEITRKDFRFNKDGYGYAIYTIDIANEIFSFIVISSKIDDEERSDRVISTKWDVTFALCEGELTDEMLAQSLNQLPKQEAGRARSKDIVWSRANKSTRLFEYVVDCLVNGEQPDPRKINEVGYFLRTTAVYGNGKFGLAPYEKIKENHPFSGPFQAQMFAVYLLRHFSFELIEHIAKCKNNNAIKLSPEIKKFIGTGNATGLGMAPFLISHPKLLHQWVYTREKAILRLKEICPSHEDLQMTIKYLDRIVAYFNETRLIDRGYFVKHETLADQIEIVKKWVVFYYENGTLQGKVPNYFWHELTNLIAEEISIEIEELMYTIMMEVYTDHIINLENNFNVDEIYQVKPSMQLKQLKKIIHSQYDWVFQYDFTNPDDKYYFWYRSEEKEEPRLGIRERDPGVDWELSMNIAEQVQELHHILAKSTDEDSVGSFILQYPDFKGIIQRIQSLEGYEYGEIRNNLLSKDLNPLHLLRAKLSFFGAERFNPKSDKWVRITLFQGAPLVEEIGETFMDDWVFPLMPK